MATSDAKKVLEDISVHSFMIMLIKYNGIIIICLNYLSTFIFCLVPSTCPRVLFAPGMKQYRCKVVNYMGASEVTFKMKLKVFTGVTFCISLAVIVAQIVSIWLHMHLTVRVARPRIQFLFA